jgi:TRAP-type mannitol/chloroaromatic compound transport system permease small subunit
MLRAAHAAELVVDVIGRLSAISVLTLVGIMSANVLLRYGFSIGSVWAQELEWHLMSPIALIGAAYALRHGEHVRVDVLYGRMGPSMQRAVDGVSSLLGLICCLFVAWLSFRYVGQSWGQGEGSANPGGIPARYVLKAFIPAGFLLLALQFAALCLKSAARPR